MDLVRRALAALAAFALALLPAYSDDGVGGAGGSNGLPVMPRAIPGLVFWLDASDAASITQSSGNVSAWLDKAGGLSAVSSGSDSYGTRLPTVAAGAAPSGLNGVTFNGVSNVMQVASITLPTSITVFVAGSFANTSGTHGFFMEQGSTYSVPGFHVETDTGVSLINRGGTRWNPAGRNDWGANNRPSLYDWNISSAGQSAYINGGLMPTGAVTNSYPGESNVSAALNIGGRDNGVGTFPTLYTSGTVYEILIYKASLSAANAAAVRTYLGNKWGVYAPTLAQMSYSVANAFETDTGTYAGTFVRNSTHAEAIYSTTATSLTLDSWDNGAYAVTAWQPLTTFGVYVNGSYNQTLSDSASGVNHLTATLPAGAKTVAITQGGVQSASTSYPPIVGTYVIGISFNAPVKQLFPTAPRNLVIYGDSICMGEDARPINQVSWVQLVRAGWSNSTVGSTCWGYRSLWQDTTYTTIATLVASIQSMNPTHVWLAIGTNDYGLTDGSHIPDSWTPTTFQTQYTNLLEALYTAMPTVPVYAQTPVVRSVETANHAGFTCPQFRTAIANAVTAANAAEGTTFATLVDGTATSFMPSSGLSADGIHPSTTGHAAIAAGVLAILPP